MQPPQDPEAEVISQDRMLKLAKDRQAEAAGHLGGPSGHLGCPSGHLGGPTGHLGGPTGHLGGSSKGSNMGNTNAAGTQVRGPPGYCPKCLVAGNFQGPYVFHNGGVCPNAQLPSKPSGSTSSNTTRTTPRARARVTSGRWPGGRGQQGLVGWLLAGLGLVGRLLAGLGLVGRLLAG